MRKWKTKIVGQIHDSIVADVHKSELKDFLHLCRRIMIDDLRKEWKWIIVPLEIEAEVGETNWFDKKEVDIDGVV